MILRTHRGDVEVRASPFAREAEILPWSQVSGHTASSGAVVNVGTAAGLPAAGAAIRLLSETTGMIPLLVYRGEALERERARDTWQWDLLHEAPNEDYSAFDFFQDIETSIETQGNAFVFKVKVRPRRVEALWVINPASVRVERDDANRKVFSIWNGKEREEFSSSTVLHVRGWTLNPGADVGVSPIALHRERLGAMLAEEDFGGRFFRNDGTPSGILKFPGPVPQNKAVEMLDYWTKRHTGIENKHRPGILTHGADYQQTGLSLQDAQFIESMKFSVEDIARIFRISPTMLGAVLGNRMAVTAEDFERFLKVDLAPRLRRIEMAFKSDPDLFPGDGLFPEFLSDAVLRPDIKTRYEAYRLARQGGWMKPNEIRQKENLPPADGGDEIQEVPVGGMANPSP